MKYTAVLFLLLMSTQILAQTYNFRINNYQLNGWEYFERIDPFTDEKNSRICKSAEKTTNTYPRTPILCITSHGNVYVDWKRYLSTDEYDLRIEKVHRVKYRFDKGPVIKTFSSKSVDEEATFFVESKQDLTIYNAKFLASLRKSSTLAVGTKNRKGIEYIAVFNLAGSSKAFEVNLQKIIEVSELSDLPKLSDLSSVDAEDAPPITIVRKPIVVEKRRRSVERSYNSMLYGQLRGQINAGPQFDKKLSVAIELQIESNGSVSAYKIKESSGVSPFDLAVTTSIKNIKFPKLPQEISYNPPYIVTIRIQP